MRLLTPRLASADQAALVEAEARLLAATESYALQVAGAVAALPGLDMDEQRDVVDQVAETVTLVRCVIGGGTS